MQLLIDDMEEVTAHYHKFSNASKSDVCVMLEIASNMLRSRKEQRTAVNCTSLCIKHVCTMSNVNNVVEGVLHC